MNTNEEKLNTENEFANKHDLLNQPSVEDFIAAKEAEICEQEQASSCQIDQGLINEFYKQLNDYGFDWASVDLDEDELPGGEDYRVYEVVEMLEAWATAEAELG